MKSINLMRLVCWMIASMIVVWATQSLAECQSEIRILGDDLAGVRLAPEKNMDLADKVFKARRYCYLGDEKTAMRYLNAARKLAGLPESKGEFDWENVPIDSLESLPEN